MRRGIIFLGILLLLASFAVAEEGCFLYSEHPSYCQDIEKSLVEADCAEEENCDMSMFKAEKCSNFPECSVILCSSSCLTTFKGSCSGDAVVEGDISCSTGCCGIGTGCETVSSKAECLINAKNEGANEFSFTTGECGVNCPVGVTKEEVLGAEKIEKVEEKESSFGVGWVFVVVILGLVLLFVFAHFRRGNNAEEVHLTSFEQISKWIPTVLSELKLKKKKKKYSTQRSHRQRAQELRSFGIGPGFGAEKMHENLQKMIRVHKKKKEWKKRSHSIEDLDLLLGNTKAKKRTNFDKKVFARLDRIGKPRKK